MTSKWNSRTDQAKRKVHDRVAGQLTDMAADIVKQAQENANASPPGHPQVQTGTLRRAITMAVDKIKLIAKVGIMKGKEKGDEALVYAARIEFGFTGTDSKGRHYNQPPYPFLFPAAELITKRAKRYFK